LERGFDLSMKTYQRLGLPAKLSLRADPGKLTAWLISSLK
jgi:hypothetical protein